jgi:hypothetical protein
MDIVSFVVILSYPLVRLVPVAQQADVPTRDHRGKALIVPVNNRRPRGNLCAMWGVSSDWKVKDPHRYAVPG